MVWSTHLTDKSEHHFYGETDDTSPVEVAPSEANRSNLGDRDAACREPRVSSDIIEAKGGVSKTSRVRDLRSSAKATAASAELNAHAASHSTIPSHSHSRPMIQHGGYRSPSASASPKRYDSPTGGEGGGGVGGENESGDEEGSNQGQQDSQHMSREGRASERGRTCVSCRKSKVKCSRGTPCFRCRRLKLNCVAQTRGRGRPKTSAKMLNVEPASPNSARSGSSSGSASSESRGPGAAAGVTCSGATASSRKAAAMNTDINHVPLPAFMGGSVSVAPAAVRSIQSGADRTGRRVNGSTSFGFASGIGGDAPQALMVASQGYGLLGGPGAHRDAPSGPETDGGGSRAAGGHLGSGGSPSPTAPAGQVAPQHRLSLEAFDVSRPFQGSTSTPSSSAKLTSSTHASGSGSVHGLRPMQVLAPRLPGGGGGGSSVCPQSQMGERPSPMWQGVPGSRRQTSSPSQSWEDMSRGHGVTASPTCTDGASEKAMAGEAGGANRFSSSVQTERREKHRPSFTGGGGGTGIASARAVGIGSANGIMSSSGSKIESKIGSFLADFDAAPGDQQPPVSLRDAGNDPGGGTGSGRQAGVGGMGGGRGISPLWPSAVDDDKRGPPSRGNKSDAGYSDGRDRNEGLRLKPAKQARLLPGINASDGRSGLQTTGGGLPAVAAASGGGAGDDGSAATDAHQSAEDPTDTIVTGFWRLFNEQEVHRPKAVLVIRHWALCALDRRSTRLMRKTVSMARALCINVGEILNDYSIYAMFHTLLKEAEAGQPVTPVRHAHFEHRVEVPRYIQELESTVAAVSVRVVVRGQSCFYHNDVCSRLFLSSEGANDMYAANQQDVWGTCIHPDDHKTFFESLSLQLFHVPGHFSESTQILKCRDRFGVAFLALVHFRYEFQDGGNYAAFGLSMHPLPHSPYLRSIMPGENDHGTTVRSSLPMNAHPGSGGSGGGAGGGEGRGKGGSFAGGGLPGPGRGVGGMEGGFLVGVSAPPSAAGFQPEMQLSSSSSLVLPPLDVVDGGRRRVGEPLPPPQYHQHHQHHPQEQSACGGGASGSGGGGSGCVGGGGGCGGDVCGSGGGGVGGNVGDGSELWPSAANTPPPRSSSSNTSSKYVEGSQHQQRQQQQQQQQQKWGAADKHHQGVETGVGRGGGEAGVGAQVASSLGNLESAKFTKTTTGVGGGSSSGVPAVSGQLLHGVGRRGGVGGDPEVEFRQDGGWSAAAGRADLLRAPRTWFGEGPGGASSLQPPGGISGSADPGEVAQQQRE